MAWTNSTYDIESKTATLFWNQGEADEFIYVDVVDNSDQNAMNNFVSDAKKYQQIFQAKYDSRELLKQQNESASQAILAAAQE